MCLVKVYNSTYVTNLWSIIGKNGINNYMKTIVHVFLIWQKDILKVIEQNIFFQNSFSLWSSKKWWYRDPKYLFIWKSDRFIYKVFAR